LNEDYWEKTAAEIGKKKIRKYNSMPVLDNYYLEYILKAGGWDIIRSSLVLDSNPNKVEIVGVKIVKGVSLIDQLENIINVDSIVKYFKDKQE